MLKANFNTDHLSSALGVIFSKFGFSPNTWTLFSLIPAVIGFVCLLPQYYHSLILGLVFFMLSGLVDAIDGAVARATKNVTDKGAYIDGIVDRYVEILLYLGLLFYGIPEVLLPSPAWLSILIFGAAMTSFSRAYADHRKIVTSPEDLKRMGGILERFERLTLIFIGMLAGYFIGPFYITYAVMAAAILANITALQRILFAVRCK
jgi:phosphatidylglycerophosphate synthase